MVIVKLKRNVNASALRAYNNARLHRLNSASLSDRVDRLIMELIGSQKRRSAKMRLTMPRRISRKLR